MSIRQQGRVVAINTSILSEFDIEFWLLTAMTRDCNTFYAFRLHGLQQEIIYDSLLALCDFQGSGELEFEEFANLAAKFMVEEDTSMLRDELRQAFLLFDRERRELKKRILCELIYHRTLYFLTNNFFHIIIRFAHKQNLTQSS